MNNKFKNYFNNLPKSFFWFVIGIVIIVFGIYLGVKKPSAQVPPPETVKWDWANQIGGTNDDKVLGVVTDSAGNSYVTGYFKSDAIFVTDECAITPGITGACQLGNSGSATADIFIAKFDSSGVLQWARLAGGRGNDYGNAIALDPTENFIYVTGSFEAKVFFYEQTGVGESSVTLNSSGASDLFLAKFDSSTGLLVPGWAKSGGDAGNDSGEAVAVDVNLDTGINFVYAVGYFTGNGTSEAICVDEPSLTTIPSTSTDKNRIFLMFEGTGNDLDSDTDDNSCIGGFADDDLGDDANLGVSVDSTNDDFYLTGYFNGNAVFNDPIGANPAIPISSVGLSDAFVAKYNINDFSIKWARAYGGDDSMFTDKASDIGVDSSGNPYVTGLFKGNATSTFPPDITVVAAGANHSLALESGGTLWAWGRNNLGQLGNGTIIDRKIPIQVCAPGVTATNGSCDDDGPGGNDPQYLMGITDVAGGGVHSLALKSDGTVLAWGSNGNGQLGDGSNSNRNIPVSVSSLTGITAIAGGATHSLALELNDGSNTCPNDGSNTTCNGQVWAWGFNGNGQLGDGSNTNQTTPVLVSFLTGITSIAAGGNHSLAIESNDGSNTCPSDGANTICNGQVWAWGSNGNGQLGDSTNADSSNVPVLIISMTSISSVGAGSGHSLVVELNDGSSTCPSDGTDTICNGQVWAWGRNTEGQLGNNSDSQMSSIPVLVSSITDIVNIDGGGDYSLAVGNNGDIWAWGRNDEGQLGNGNNMDSLTPVQVTNLSNITSVSGGVAHSLALEPDNTVWAWGFNSNGQLGDNTDTDRNVPVQTDFGDFNSNNLGLTSTSASDIFLAKLNSSNGNVTWARRMGGVSSAPPDLALDDSGVYVAGDFSTTATFDDGAGGTVTGPTSLGSFDVLASKYDLSGVLQWIKTAGGSGTDSGLSISSADTNDLRIAGTFNRIASFDSLPQLTASPLNTPDGFLARLVEVIPPVSIPTQIIFTEF